MGYFGNIKGTIKKIDENSGFTPTQHIIFFCRIFKISLGLKRGESRHVVHCRIAD